MKSVLSALYHGDLRLKETESHEELFQTMKTLFAQCDAPISETLAEALESRRGRLDFELEMHFLKGFCLGMFTLLESVQLLDTGF